MRALRMTVAVINTTHGRNGNTKKQNKPSEIDLAVFSQPESKSITEGFVVNIFVVECI